MPSPNNSSTNEIFLNESLIENTTTSLNPISAIPPSFQEAEEEARELAKVIRRMQAADKRYREESEFLLLRNEVALHTLFQGNKSTISQRELDGHFQAERDVEGLEAKSPCFQESKADEGQKIAIVDNDIGYKTIDKKWRGAINGLQEHNQMTAQSLDVQMIEDRIDKARLDLRFLEQQTAQMEIEMKALQMELAKLKDQLNQTQIQYDE